MKKRKEGIQWKGRMKEKGEEGKVVSGMKEGEGTLDKQEGKLRTLAEELNERQKKVMVEEKKKRKNSRKVLGGRKLNKQGRKLSKEERVE